MFKANSFRPDRMSSIKYSNEAKKVSLWRAREIGAGSFTNVLRITG
jgi:hypothetical protein